MADLKFLLDGQEINPPLNWQDTKVLAAWINSSVQPKVITDDLTFVNEAREKILQYVRDGENTGVGIFRGIPFQIQASDLIDGSIPCFDGYLDFLSGYTVKDERGVRTKVTRPEDLELLNKRLEALSYAYLLEKGHITKKDWVNLPYVVQNVDPAEGLFYLILTEFILAKEAIEAYERLGKVISAFANIVTTPYAILVLIITIAYFAAIVIMILRLLNEVFKKIYPRPRTQKVMSYRRLVEKAFSYMGYEFDSNIEELDTYHYVPSRTFALSAIDFIGDNFGIKKVQRTVKNYIERSAIPQPNDFGYRCSDMIQLCLDLFNAKIAVQGNKVFMYTESDPFWIKQSKFTLPDVLLDEYRYNVDQAVSTKLFSFQTDGTDEWSIEDFTGTNYEVNTQSTQTIPQRLLLLKGYKDYRWPVAIASRYARADTINKVLNRNPYPLFDNKAVNNLFKKLKISNPFKNVKPIQFNTEKGFMRVSNMFWSVPKVVALKNGKIPKNHRDLVSARTLYIKYHSYNSFAAPYTGQRKIFTNYTIPFGLKDFIDCQFSSYFKTQDGRLGRFLRLEWMIGKDMAEVDFEIFEPYIKTVKETNFEP